MSLDSFILIIPITFFCISKMKALYFITSEIRLFFMGTCVLFCSLLHGNTETSHLQSLKDEEGEEEKCRKMKVISAEMWCSEV